MTVHNIIGSERSGPHVIVRRMPKPQRRTFAHVLLEGIGGMVVLLSFTAIIWSCFNVG